MWLCSFFLHRARRWPRCERDGKGKGVACALATLHPHPSPLSLDDLCRNIEAQLKTGEGLVLLVTHPKEAFKDVFVFLWGDANAKNLHTDDDGALCERGELDQDGIARGEYFIPAVPGQ
jgi:hypothetical protein